MPRFYNISTTDFRPISFENVYLYGEYKKNDGGIGKVFCYIKSEKCISAGLRMPKKEIR